MYRRLTCGSEINTPSLGGELDDQGWWKCECLVAGLGFQRWLLSTAGDGQMPEPIGCACDPQGSISSQCDAAGQCQCKVSLKPSPL